jgi:hypothetical protein
LAAPGARASDSRTRVAMTRAAMARTTSSDASANLSL